jgi:hypothetical protein
VIPLEVAALVDEFNVGPLVVHRRTSPTVDVYGETVPAIDSPFVLDPVAVHTLTGRDLEQLPEADRHREAIQVYTKDARLYVADGFVPDVIEYRSRTFRVVHVEDYELQGEVFIAHAVLEDL